MMGRCASPATSIVILLDSLNRHLLGAYGVDRVRHAEPRPARRPVAAVRPPPHRLAAVHAGPPRHPRAGRSTSCGGRGARSRCGRTPITHHLRLAGVTTMLVSDHPHLFETGGENYHTDFAGWEYVRGHEGDPWRTAPDPSWVGRPRRARPARGGSTTTTTRRAPGSATRPTSPAPARCRRPPRGWPAQAPAADRFFLFVDEFDPHEPFDVPEPWMSRYDPDWDGPEGDLAALRRRRRRLRRARRAHRGAHPGQLRRQAQLHRPLARPRARRDRPPGPVGRHRGHPVHRPRPLPRRARRVRQARRARLRADRPHPAARRLARASRRARSTPSRPPSTSSPPCATSSA